MLTSIAPDLWCATGPQAVFGAEMGNRMTIVRLADGGLWLHAPFAIDDALAAELDALGPVRFAVAPNRFHHLTIGALRDRWPEVALHAAPGLPEKRPDLRFDGVLSDQAPEGWRRQLDQVVLGGAPALGEVLFYHRASRTLILTDLGFNYTSPPAGLWTRFFLSVTGALGGLRSSRLVRSSVKDKGAARAAVDRILMWDFERVSLCHGDIIEDDARVAVAQMLSWIGPLSVQSAD